MSARGRIPWTIEKRAAHGELTRKKMKPAAIRARIVENTKAGMARWRADRLAALCAVWKSADRHTKNQFLAEVCTATVTVK
jgi:hypothetical protein